MRLGPGVRLTQNLFKWFEVIRVPVNDIHRHVGVLVTVLLPTRVTSRLMGVGEIYARVVAGIFAMRCKRSRLHTVPVAGIPCNPLWWMLRVGFYL